MSKIKNEISSSSPENMNGSSPSPLFQPHHPPVTKPLLATLQYLGEENEPCDILIHQEVPGGELVPLYDGRDLGHGSLLNFTILPFAMGASLNLHFSMTPNVHSYDLASFSCICRMLPGTPILDGKIVIVNVSLYFSQCACCHRTVELPSSLSKKPVVEKHGLNARPKASPIKLRSAPSSASPIRRTPSDDPLSSSNYSSPPGKGGPRTPSPPKINSPRFTDSSPGSGSRIPRFTKYSYELYGKAHRPVTLLHSSPPSHRDNGSPSSSVFNKLSPPKTLSSKSSPDLDLGSLRKGPAPSSGPGVSPRPAPTRPKQSDAPLRDARRSSEPSLNVDAVLTHRPLSAPHAPTQLSSTPRPPIPTQDAPHASSERPHASFSGHPPRQSSNSSLGSSSPPKRQLLTSNNISSSSSSLPRRSPSFRASPVSSRPGSTHSLSNPLLPPLSADALLVLDETNEASIETLSPPKSMGGPFSSKIPMFGVRLTPLRKQKSDTLSSSSVDETLSSNDLGLESNLDISSRSSPPPPQNTEKADDRVSSISELSYGSTPSLPPVLIRQALTVQPSSPPSMFDPTLSVKPPTTHSIVSVSENKADEDDLLNVQGKDNEEEIPSPSSSDGAGDDEQEGEDATSNEGVLIRSPSTGSIILRPKTASPIPITKPSSPPQCASSSPRSPLRTEQSALSLLLSGGSGSDLVAASPLRNVTSPPLHVPNESTSSTPSQPAPPSLTSAPASITKPLAKVLAPVALFQDSEQEEHVQKAAPSSLTLAPPPEVRIRTSSSDSVDSLLTSFSASDPSIVDGVRTPTRSEDYSEDSCLSPSSAYSPRSERKMNFSRLSDGVVRSPSGSPSPRRRSGLRPPPRANNKLLNEQPDSDINNRAILTISENFGVDFSEDGMDVPMSPRPPPVQEEPLTRITSKIAFFRAIDFLNEQSDDKGFSPAMRSVLAGEYYPDLEKLGLYDESSPEERVLEDLRAFLNHILARTDLRRLSDALVVLEEKHAAPKLPSSEPQQEEVSEEASFLSLLSAKLTAFSSAPKDPKWLPRCMVDEEEEEWAPSKYYESETGNDDLDAEEYDVAHVDLELECGATVVRRPSLPILDMLAGQLNARPLNDPSSSSLEGSPTRPTKGLSSPGLLPIGEQVDGGDSAQDHSHDDALPVARD